MTEDQMASNCMVYFKSWTSRGVATKNYAKTVNTTRLVCISLVQHVSA